MSQPLVPRRVDRRPVELGANCRTGSGLRGPARISDISTMGCRIVSTAVRGKVGFRLVVRPEGMEGLAATVRWIDGNAMGLEFDTPLYPPVVDHLTHRYAADPAISVSHA